MDKKQGKKSKVKGAVKGVYIAVSVVLGLVGIGGVAALAYALTTFFGG